MLVAVRHRTLSDAERRTGTLTTRGGSAPSRVVGERCRTVGGGPASPVPVPGAATSAPAAAPRDTPTTLVPKEF
jgi:hypothetical protein